MNANENNDALSISLKEMLALFMKRLWLILLVAVLVGGSCFVYLTETYVEEYTSKSTIFLFYKEEGRSGSAAMSYLEVALYTLNDCKQILTSRRVLESVRQDIEEDENIPIRWKREINQLGYNGLKRSISISNVSDSRVLEISVRSFDPEFSKVVVDRICSYGANEIKYYMGFDQVRVIDEGTLNRAPSNPVSLLIPLVAAFGAGFLVFAIFLIVKLSDNKVNTSEDVEKHLGLSVLAEIPSYNATNRTKRYY